MKQTPKPIPNVVVRYVELPPTRIFNWLAAENITSWNMAKDRHDIWWDQETIEWRERFAGYWREAFDDLTGHFTKLKKSINENGLLRPISVVSGSMRDMYMLNELPPKAYLPLKYQHDVTELIYTKVFGGSRLTIADELGIEKVPCVIHDFSNLFPDAEEVTYNKFLELFGNDYSFRGTTLPRITVRKHLHFDGGNRFSQMNNHTRTAQGEASRMAWKRINA